MTQAQREALGLFRLPESLNEALIALESDSVARGFFAPKALATYLGMKRAEIAQARDLDPAALCRRYAQIY